MTRPTTDRVKVICVHCILEMMNHENPRQDREKITDLILPEDVFLGR